MNETNHIVDENITLDRLNPPIYQGRMLQWSGEGDEPGQPGRIPEPGEAVLWEKGPFATVETYFQDHGFLGVKVSLETTGEVVCLFGFEIEVAPSSPNRPIPTNRSNIAGGSGWVN